MSMTNIIPNMLDGNQGAVSKGIQAIGVPPVGNAGGSTNPGPTAMNSAVNPIMQNSVVPGVNTGLIGPQGAIPTAVQPALNKQLTDVYGQGTGGAIDSAITNLGSNDSTYMQAYTAAQAQPNAENLATLNTSLSNGGVSANSSTMAIADADFETGVTSQEGLQEQQLQQTDEQNMLGLLTSTEGASNKEASTSIWGDIGDVLGSVGQDAGGILGAIGDAGLL